MSNTVRGLIQSFNLRGGRVHSPSGDTNVSGGTPTITLDASLVSAYQRLLAGRTGALGPICDAILCDSNVCDTVCDIVCDQVCDVVCDQICDTICDSVCDCVKV